MDNIKIKIQEHEYTINNNNGKYDRAKHDAGENATLEQIFAHYDKLAGLIRDEVGQKLENGKFWGPERERLAKEPAQLKYKTDEDLQEIMRNSIDNSYVTSSIYHKAKQEFEFRNREKQGNKKEEILKLSPEIYGMGINLKPLWKWVKSLF